MNGTRLVKCRCAVDKCGDIVTGGSGLAILPEAFAVTEGQSVLVANPTPVEWEDLEGMGWTPVGGGFKRETRAETTIYAEPNGDLFQVYCTDWNEPLCYPDLATALLVADLIAQGQGGWA